MNPRILTNTAIGLAVLLQVASAFGVQGPAVVRHFTPGARVFAMESDHERFLWFGTEHGLVRYDGFAMKQLSPADTVVAAVSSLLVDRTGVLWIGARGSSRLLRVDRGVVATVDSGLATDVTALAKDKHGIWIGTGHGLLRMREGHIEQVPVKPGSPTNFSSSTPITRLLVTKNAELWVGHEGGIVRFVNEQFFPVGPPVTVLALSQDALGRIWASQDGQQGARLFDSAGVQIGSVKGQQANAFLADDDGSMWLATGYGLWRADQSLVVRQVWLGPSVDPRLLSLQRDADGTLWAGTASSGAMQVDENPVLRVLGASEGLRQEFAFSVAEDSDEQLWISTAENLALWRSGQFQLVEYGPTSGLPYDLRALAASRRGVWAASAENGVFHVSATPGAAPAVKRFTAIGAHSVHEAADGSLWIGWAKGGLGRSIDKGPANPVAIGTDAVVTVMTDATPEGLWVGTVGAGLRRLHADGRIDVYDKTQGLPHNSVNDVAELPDRTVCTATRGGGLDCLENGHFTHFGASDGVTDEEVGAIVTDSHGAVWLGTVAGILRLDHVPSTKRQGVAAQVFGLGAGLHSVECLLGPGPAVTRTVSGSLMFATTSGVAWIDPVALKRTNAAPVFVDELVLNGAVLPRSTRPEAPLGNGNLEIRYTSPRFAGADQLSFRYRLEGQDRDWVAAGSRRAAFYTNLAARSYRFVVAVDDGAGSRQAVFSFRLHPPLYRTWYFLMLVASMALIAIGVAFRARGAHLRARADAIAAERQRLARDLHDTVEQSVVAVHLQIDGAMHELDCESPQPPAALRHLERGLELLKQASLGMHNAIFALRTAPRMLDLPMALSNAAGRLLRGTQVDFEVVAPDSLPILRMQVQQQVVLIVQEALTNAIKHGRARNIRTTIDSGAREMHITVTDDGCGFDVNTPAPSGHYGVIGMRERAAQIQGDLSVQSRPGEGCAVALRVPLHAVGDKQ